MTGKRFAMMASTAGFCAALGWWFFSGVSRGEKATQAAKEDPGDRLPTVVALFPRVSDIRQSLELPGGLEPYEVAKLRAKVTGYLESIGVDLGDRVKKGDVLAELGIPEMEPELETAGAKKAAAEARLEKARADAELASVTHRRVADLHASEPGAISKQDVDVAAAEAKVADARVRVAESEAEVAASETRRLEALIGYAKIRAPFDGVVTKRFAHTGALMQAGSPSDAVVEVVRAGRLRLVVEIPEAAVPHVQEGKELRFTVDALPGESFSGKVDRLSGALDPRTRNRRVEMDLDTRGGKLVPGMYATVHLDLASFENATVLPAEVIHKVGGSTCVYTVDAGRLDRVPVALLMDDGEEVVVSGDLDADTAVVRSMPRLAKPGDEVRVRRDAPPASSGSE